MQTKSLDFASLFAGCGGFDVGLMSTGFALRGAFDFDPTAIANYRRNIAEDLAWRVDLTDGLPNESRLRNVSVVIAGPPCQGFSTAGRRNVDDARNHLVPLTATLALRLMPQVIVVENVTAAKSGDHAQYWTSLTQQLRTAGYKTHDIIVRTADLGMAQTRNRLLLFAWRTGREVTFWFPGQRPRMLREALKCVHHASNHSPVILQPGSPARLIADKIKPQQKLCNVRGGERAVHTWHIPEVFGPVTDAERTLLELLGRLRRQSRQRDVGDADPVSIKRLAASFGAPFRRLLRSLEAKGYVRRMGSDYDLAHTFNGLYRRLAWHKPSLTVDTRFGSPRHFLHPAKPRGFTVREAARIQGFSDQYIFCGDHKQHYKLIGNAVPPPIGRFVGGFTRYLLTGDS